MSIASNMYTSASTAQRHVAQFIRHSCFPVPSLPPPPPPPPPSSTWCYILMCYVPHLNSLLPISLSVLIIIKIC